MPKRKPAPPARNLRDLLKRQAGKPTVLGVALPVLAATIDAARAGDRFLGVTGAEIRAGFRSVAAAHLRADFHTTYLARPLAARGYLLLEGGRYRFRPELIEGASADDLSALRDELLQSLRDEAERRRGDIARLEGACAAPLDRHAERRQLVEALLADFGANSGETFEIMSYTILREYFASFGFRLQRFSTTHANDGGMDYVGGDCIYQVSTDGGLPKLEGDMLKAPGVKRVVVRPELDGAARARADEAELARVELGDLLNHFIAWLAGRDQASRRARHLQAVLEVALHEFRREDRAAVTGAGRVLTV